MESGTPVRSTLGSGKLPDSKLPRRISQVERRVRYQSRLIAEPAHVSRAEQLTCRIGASHGLQIPLYYRKLRAAKDQTWETGEDANWGMTMQTLQSTRTQAQVARTREAGMVVIIRGVPPDWAVPIGEALLAADVDVMEITLNTPQALEMIAALRAALGEQMVIGAGTVLSVEDAEHALAAGAEFFVSPHLDTEIVALRQRTRLHGNSRRVHAYGGVYGTARRCEYCEGISREYRRPAVF